MQGERATSSTEVGMDIATSSSEPAGLPWIEKYRPASLNDLIGNQDITAVLNRLIDSNKLPHLLFYGPPGTGKTSTILACARKMYGNNFSSMVLELNASDDRGIDVVRDQIKEFAGTKKLFSSGLKLVILDEADAMTNDAQFALRRVIEKYTSNTRFCMICNYVNKIIPALQSRCTKFRFGPLETEHIRGRLEHVIQQEGVRITPQGVEAILGLAQGDMRRVLNLLQAASMAYSDVSDEAVYLCAGSPLPGDIDQIQHSLLNDNFQDAYNLLREATLKKGYALADIIKQLVPRLTQIEFPDPVLAHLLEKLADVEYRLAYSINDKLQVGALVGAFTVARNMMTA